MSQPLVYAIVAGLLASLACGLGVLPLLIPGLDPKRHTGLGYAFAGGLMVSASVYNLLNPGIAMGGEVSQVNLLKVILGVLLGATFLSISDRWIAKHNFTSRTFLKNMGGRSGLLIFLAMCVHSIPEGVAVGVGYTFSEVAATGQIPAAAGDLELGAYLALAIAIHNVPEGLAVAIPMRSAGVSLHRCFWAAVATSLPQPLAAGPAVLLAWFFQPLMPVLMGFAAGAMIFLVVLELIPGALHVARPRPIAWAFMAGFCLMILIQVAL